MLPDLPFDSRNREPSQDVIADPPQGVKALEMGPILVAVCAQRPVEFISIYDTRRMIGEIFDRNPFEMAFPGGCALAFDFDPGTILASHSLGNVVASHFVECVLGIPVAVILDHDSDCAIAFR